VIPKIQRAIVLSHKISFLDKFLGIIQRIKWLEWILGQKLKYHKNKN